MNSNECKAREIISKITYKPGWKLEILSEFDLRRESFVSTFYCERIVMRITMVWPDVTRPDNRPTPFSTIQILEMFGPLNEQHFIEWVAMKIRYAEEHEFREWFKIDGFSVFDPHPEIRRDASAL